MPSLDDHEHCIHVKGAREHNLKNIEVFIPRDKLTVITGVSGSGKSSLAFDTIYAEGYRKYIDSLSVSARQAMEQLAKPSVDFIEGLSPVIAIEQRTGHGANPRSTVATVSEIADYARLVWAVAGIAHCPKDGGLIVRRSLDECIARILEEPEGSRIMLLAPYMKEKASVLREELPRLHQKGFQRVRIDGEIKELDEPKLIEGRGGIRQVDIVIDRLTVAETQRSRLADSLELAFEMGSDQAIVMIQESRDVPWREFTVSQHLACNVCGTVYAPITPRSFSFNHPDGACSTCGGIGQTMQFSEALIVPDGTKSVKNGAIKPWRLGSKQMIIQRNAILKQLAEQYPFDPKTPWQDLPEQVRQDILRGTGDRKFLFKLKAGNRKPEETTFEGVLADLRRSRAETTSDGFRAKLMAYQTTSLCPECHGQKLRPESLAVLVGGKNFAEFHSMSIDDAHAFIAGLIAEDKTVTHIGEALHGLESRLRFLREVGLGYLSLNREYATLSGGEAQRTRLATQLGMGLVGVAYVLDEPTIGLHPSDCQKLLETIETMRNRGNTVIVVEHDEETMHRADHLIELGPGAGEQGGRLIAEGTFDQFIKTEKSLTARYLTGKLSVTKDADQGYPGRGWLTVEGATEHNLKDVSASFPIGLLTVVTGVSGSGKSTLVNDILANAAAFKLNRAKTIPGRHRKLIGLDQFRTVVRVDQSPIGRSPRSNPATFTKLFDLLRDLYARTSLAKIRGYQPGRFSFNTSGGRCERCKGDGMIRLDMQFLSDVYVECPACQGKRYNRETLEVRFKGFNIAEVLEMSIDEATKVFSNQPRIMEKLRTLSAVGLSYLRLGQSATTLSGGEAQRLKLSLELSRRQQGDTLYILDEPTTGLHWADVQHLMDLLFQLRDAGNTIIIIEHDLDVINLADWVIDLGPGGGNAGGEVVFQGNRDDLLKCDKSLTADALKKYLDRRKSL